VLQADSRPTQWTAGIRVEQQAAWAAREGIPLLVIPWQLGHADLSVTTEWEASAQPTPAASQGCRRVRSASVRTPVPAAWGAGSASVRVIDPGAPRETVPSFDQPEAQ
jgi:hypothetical protein